MFSTFKTSHKAFILNLKLSYVKFIYGHFKQYQCSTKFNNVFNIQDIPQAFILNLKLSYVKFNVCHFFSLARTAKKLLSVIAVNQAYRNFNVQEIPQAFILNLKLSRIKFNFCPFFHPRLELLKNNIVIAVNQAYLDFGQDIVLNQGDHIAVIPPLSGGQSTKR